MVDASWRVVRPGDLADLQARLAAAPRVAVDTEFHAERRYLPKLYLVQLHLDDGTTWVVDALRPELLRPLAEPLRSLTWVVHGGQQDMRLLLDALGGLPDLVRDTQIAAGLVGERWPASYSRLLRERLGREVPKLATLSDWSRRPLSQEQLRYAAEDVQLLLELWDRLDGEARDLDRQALVDAACLRARGEVLEPPPADVAWREVPGAVVLGRQEAAVLQELAAWREETARELDQPPFYILNNGVLLDLARRQPLTLESLASNRRLPKAVVTRHGAALLERIQRAGRRPEWGWPRPIPEASPEGRTAAWLTSWARADGHRHRYAARLVLPTRLAEDLALDRPASREALAAVLGWRDPLVGDRLWEALNGRVSLTLGPADVELP